ncbi:hypothetical protein KGY64_03460 [Candidatus Bipolaricaulota bacterium]|nr:hypothetical protein [Candidatus Bipolaricaulota bacterium]
MSLATPDSTGKFQRKLKRLAKRKISVCFVVKLYGLPGAVVPHAGFDEQRQETYYGQG